MSTEGAVRVVVVPVADSVLASTDATRLQPAKPPPPPPPPSPPPPPPPTPSVVGRRRPIAIIFALAVSAALASLLPRFNIKTFLGNGTDDLGMSLGAPSSRIEQVALYVGRVNTELTVSWAAPLTPRGQIPSGSRLFYGVGALIYSSPATCSQYSAPPSYASPALCHANFSHFSSVAASWYRVGDDTNGWSSTSLYVHRMPDVGEAGATFAVVGDVGTTADSASTLTGVAEAHARSPFAALLLVGDISYADGDQSIWDEWGRLSSRLLSRLPLATIPGNHEWFDTENEPCDYTQPPYCNYTFAAYLARSHTPRAALSSSNGGASSSLYYSFDAGLAHVIMLQGYCPMMKHVHEQPCLADGSLQALWLIDDLKHVDRDKTPWIIVSFHQPFVNSNHAHSHAEGNPIKEAIEATLNAYGVDLVLSGHVHAYERSARTRDGQCDPAAPVYITIGDGGNREGLETAWTNPQPEWSLFRQSSYGHGQFTAFNATHAQWRWLQNTALAPSLLDQVFFIKGQAGQCGGGVTRVPQRRRLGSPI